MRDRDLPADVLAAARRREPAAVEALYRRYAPAVLAYHRSRVGDAHLAEDLTSDAFVAVLRSLPSYDGGPEAFAGWLFTIVRRDLLDHVRQRGRRPETPVAAEDLAHASTAVAEDVAAVVEERARAEQVRAALAELSEDQREVLVLRVVAGLTAPEIAAATGRTVGAVKALQHRGLDSLGRLLGKSKDPYPRKASRRL